MYKASRYEIIIDSLAINAIAHPTRGVQGFWLR